MTSSPQSAPRMGSIRTAAPRMRPAQRSCNIRTQQVRRMASTVAPALKSPISQEKRARRDNHCAGAKREVSAPGKCTVQEPRKWNLPEPTRGVCLRCLPANLLCNSHYLYSIYSNTYSIQYNSGGALQGPRSTMRPSPPNMHTARLVARPNCDCSYRLACTAGFANRPERCAAPRSIRRSRAN